jgi:hypothetical protein
MGRIRNAGSRLDLETADDAFQIAEVIAGRAIAPKSHSATRD